ncbi:MAG: T9SS type A sorting domain-containing protein, partial [Candidatus Kapabacteria bacterium]|nr:T9SS type A sorting domain-containing protein [Candidatus Kapabacteria bacterium]
ITTSTHGKNEASTDIALRGKGNPVGNVPYGETSDGSMTIAMVPNPVYGSSNFVYTVNNSVNSNVKIVVVDISGKVVSELVNGSIPGGEYSMNFSAEYLPAGLYYVYAESDGKKAGLPIIITK